MAYADRSKVQVGTKSCVAEGEETEIENCSPSVITNENSSTVLWIQDGRAVIRLGHTRRHLPGGNSKSCIVYSAYVLILAYPLEVAGQLHGSCHV